ncbi:MAG: phospholipid/cholesterol/gamma-HCH transport system substrate-binding protein [Solirubrobacteraceae bacterium]|nr:phospholipid/cholesterol/gamma-HCH transport system substrate-binding protein [Solirubrobacteraceae bacterium]
MRRPGSNRTGRGLTPFATGIVLIVVVALAGYLAFAKSIPFRHHFTIHAAFKSANNIKPSSPVRIAGVDVGKVTGVHHISGGGQGAIVDLRIDSAGLPLHADATMTIRPRIFLEGNFFLDVHPGSPSAPLLHDGDTVSIQQTAAPVQLDQVLATLDSSTRSDLKVLLHELSIALSGRGGAGFNRSIPFWAPAYKGTALVTDALQGTSPHDLSKLIAGMGQVASAADADPRALRALVTNLDRTVTPLARENRALAAAIAELPRTLRAGIPALDALDASFPSLRTLVAELRPAVRSTLPVLVAGIPFARQVRRLVAKPELRGLVSDLRPTVAALTRLNIESVALLGQVRAASSCQNSVILPWSQQTIEDTNFPAAGPVFQEFPKSLVGLGGDSREGDANGIWFRVLAGLGNVAFPSSPGQLTLSNFPIAGSNPVKPAGKPAFDETAPCETQQAPNLDSTPGLAPGGQISARSAPLNPAGQKLYARSEKLALKATAHQLKVEHLTRSLRVTAAPLAASLVPQLGSLGRLPGGGR